MLSTIKAARMLGWTSLAVGATELVATRWLERTMGVKRHGPLLKSYGVREIAAGITILNQPGLNKTLVTGLWGRVVGDVADLATLSLAKKESRKPEGLATITAIVMAVTATDIGVAVLAERDLQKASRISKAAKQRVQQTSAKPAAQFAVHEAAAHASAAH